MEIVWWLHIQYGQYYVDVSCVLVGLYMQPPTVKCHVLLTLYRRRGDCFILSPSPYRDVNTFHLGYKN